MCDVLAAACTCSSASLRLLHDDVLANITIYVDRVVKAVRNPETQTRLGLNLLSNRIRFVHGLSFFFKIWSFFLDIVPQLLRTTSRAWPNPSRLLSAADRNLICACTFTEAFIRLVSLADPFCVKKSYDALSTIQSCLRKAPEVAT